MGEVQGGGRTFVRLGARSAAPAVRQKNRGRSQAFIIINVNVPQRPYNSICFLIRVPP